MPWNDDPIVSAPQKAMPWDNDPVIGEQATATLEPQSASIQAPQDESIGLGVRAKRTFVRGLLGPVVKTAQGLGSGFENLDRYWGPIVKGPDTTGMTDEQRQQAVSVHLQDVNDMIYTDKRGTFNTAYGAMQNYYSAQNATYPDEQAKELALSEARSTPGFQMAWDQAQNQAVNGFPAQGNMPATVGFESVPQAKTIGEKVVDFTAGTAAWLATAALAKKAVPSSLVSAEVANIYAGGTPGEGAAQVGAIGAMNKIPVPGPAWVKMGVRTLAEMAAWYGYAKAKGSDNEDATIGALFPLVFKGMGLVSGSTVKEWTEAGSEQAREVASRKVKQEALSNLGLKQDATPEQVQEAYPQWEAAKVSEGVSRLSQAEKQAKSNNPTISDSPTVEQVQPKAEPTVKENLPVAAETPRPVTEQSHKDVKLNLENDVYGSSHDQVDGSIYAKDPADGALVGKLDYALYDGKAYINWIESGPRRQGIATKLYQKFAKEYPDYEIRWTNTTPDGTALRESLKNKGLLAVNDRTPKDVYVKSSNAETPQASKTPIPPDQQSAPAEIVEPGATSSGIDQNKSVNVMGTPARHIMTNHIDGVDYEIYRPDNLNDSRGFIRVIDKDSGEVVTLKEFPTYAQALNAYNQVVNQLAVNAPLPDAEKTPIPADQQTPPVEIVEPGATSKEIATKEPLHLNLHEILSEIDRLESIARASYDNMPPILKKDGFVPEYFLRSDNAVRYAGLVREKAVKEKEAKAKSISNIAKDMASKSKETYEAAKLREATHLSEQEIELAKGITKPITVVGYHGSYKSFDTFDSSKTATTDAGFLGRGYYFYSKESYAKQHGSNVIKRTLRINRPLFVDEMLNRSTDEMSAVYSKYEKYYDLKLSELLKLQRDGYEFKQPPYWQARSYAINRVADEFGYDGAIIRGGNIKDFPHTEIAVFNNPDALNAQEQPATVQTSSQNQSIPQAEPAKKIESDPLPAVTSPEIATATPDSHTPKTFTDIKVEQARINNELRQRANDPADVTIKALAFDKEPEFSPAKSIPSIAGGRTVGVGRGNRVAIEVRNKAITANVKEFLKSTPEFAIDPTFTVSGSTKTEYVVRNSYNYEVSRHGTRIEAKKSIRHGDKLDKDSFIYEEKVTDEIRLRFHDGYQFSFKPEVFGIDASDLKAGQRVRIDLSSFGVDPAKYIKMAEYIERKGNPKLRPERVSFADAPRYEMELGDSPKEAARREELGKMSREQLQDIAYSLKVETESETSNGGRKRRPLGELTDEIISKETYLRQQARHDELIANPVEAVQPESRIISEESYKKAVEEFNSPQLNVGLPFNKYKALATMGAYHIENGIRTFAAWSRKMIEHFKDIGLPVEKWPSLPHLWRKLQAGQVKGVEIGADARLKMVGTEKAIAAHWDKTKGAESGKERIRQVEKSTGEPSNRETREAVKKIVSPEDAPVVSAREALTYAMRKEVKAAKEGYKAGMRFGMEWAKSKEKMKAKDLQRTQQELAKFARETLPNEEAAKMLPALAKARRPIEVQAFAKAVNILLDKYEHAQAFKEFKEVRSKVAKDLAHMEPVGRAKLSAILDSLADRTMSHELRHRLENIIEHFDTQNDTYDKGLVEDSIKALRMAGRTPTNKLPTETIQAITETIQNLAAQSRLKQTLVAGRKARAFEADKTAIVDEIKTSETPFKDDIVAPEGAAPRTGALKTLANEGTRRVKHQTERIGETFKRYMYDNLRDAEAKRDAIQNEAEYIVKDFGDKHGWTDKHWREFSELMSQKPGGSKPVTLDLPGTGKRTFRSRAELVHISWLGTDPYARNAMFEGGLKPIHNRGAEVWKITPRDLIAITESLTPQELQFRDAIADHVRTKGRQYINEASMKLAGYEKAINDSYSPVKRDMTETQKDLSEVLLTHGRRALESMGILRSREGGKMPILYGDAIEMYFDHMSKVASYGGMAPAVRDALMLLGNPDVSKAIRNRLGSQALEFYRNRLDVIAGMDTGNRGMVSKFYSRVLDTSTKAVLRLNPTSGLKQYSALLKALPEHGEALLGGIAKVMTPAGAKQALAEMLEYSPPMVRRYHLESVNLKTPVFNQNKLSISRMNSLDTKYSLLWHGDRYTALAFWETAKTETAKESPDLKGDAYWEKVSTKQRDIMDDYQNSTSVVDMPQMMLDARGSALAKTMTWMMSEANNTTSLVRQSLWEIRRGKNVSMNVGRIASCTIVAALYAELIDQTRRVVVNGKDYGSPLEWALGVVSQNIGNVLVIGKLARAIESELKGFGSDSGDPVERVAESAVKTGVEIGKAVANWDEQFKSGKNKGEGKGPEHLKRAAYNMASAAAMLTGAPITPINYAIAAGKRADSDKVKPVLSVTTPSRGGSRGRR